MTQASSLMRPSPSDVNHHHLENLAALLSIFIVKATER